MKKEKINRTPEEKKARRKKRNKTFLKVLACFSAAVIVFVGITTCITAVSVKSNVEKAQTFPTVEQTEKLDIFNYENGCWDIHTDKELKVIQLTDVHIGGGWMSGKKDGMAMNAVAAMVSAEKPDLVIVTGDISYPVPFQAGTFNNKSGAKIFAALMEKLGVYWTMTFGNHDTEAYSYYSREELTAFYSSGDYPHCLLQAGPDDVDGSGNQVINIVNSDNIITRTLILMDSHSYVDGDYLGIQWKYDNIHENQINWYKETIAEIDAKNEKTLSTMNAAKATEYAQNYTTVPTSVFFHIPMSEYRDAWTQYVENDYKDTEDVKYKYGMAGETGLVVYCGLHEDNMFETMLELGSTDTVFVGHDHYNNFSLNYKGIYLTYGMSIDYLAYPGIYKKGSQRGCTVITYSADGSVDFNSQSYYQDKYISNYDKETVEMQFSDDK